VVPSIASRRDARAALSRAAARALLLCAAACSGGGGGQGSGAASRLSVSETKLSFGDHDQGDVTFEVRNAAAGRLDFTIAVDLGNGPPGWLSVFPSSGTSHGESRVVHVGADRSLLAPGSYNGVVHVEAGADVADLPVALDVVGVQADLTAVDFGFDSDAITISPWNGGGGLLAFHAAAFPDWLIVDPQSGTSSGFRDPFPITLSVDRTGLSGGHYSGSLELQSDAGQGPRSLTVPVSMDVATGGGDLEVTPSDRLSSSGPVGGPFAPASLDYLLTNGGDAPLDWTASATQPWLDLSAASGTLAPAASTTVTASIDPAVAATLPPGALHDAVTFQNLTNGNGGTARGADLTVLDPELAAVIYVPPNPMRIAPFTTLFSAADSIAGAQPIVRWDWDFGDSDPRNPRIDTEKLVVHQFSSPGTFTVKLTVTDAAGCTSSATMTLVVTPFTGQTFYVSSSIGSDGNDGRSELSPFQTLEFSLSQMTENVASQPDRLLLRRGDTWVLPGEKSLPTPSLFDAYGDGPLPVIEFPNPDSGLTWHGDSGGTPNDWGYAAVLSNLHLRHPVRNASTWLVNAFLPGSTLRGCTLENGAVVGTLQGEGLLLEDCDVSWGRNFGLYSSGGSVVCRRCRFTGSGSDEKYDHQIYLNNGSRWLLEECLFDGAHTGLNNNAAKLNGGIGVVVRRCEARGTRNGFDAGRNLEEISGGPADDYLFDECISHDNGFDGQAAGLTVSWIRHVMVRNCVFYDLNATGEAAGAIWLWDSNSDQNQVELCNNVFYANSIPDVYFSSPLYQLMMRDNVFLRLEPAGAGGFMRLNDPAAMLPLIDSDHDVFFWTGRSSADPAFCMNALDANLSFDDWRATYGMEPNGLFGDPAFTDAPDLDFTLKTGSPAIDAGATLEDVPRDKSGVPRPRGAAYDAGVFER
jgi:PKD domain-containing protein/BACON domain-containing protein